MTNPNPIPNPTDHTKPYHLTDGVRCWVVNFSRNAAITSMQLGIVKFPLWREQFINLTGLSPIRTIGNEIRILVYVYSQSIKY